jgi:ABC-type sugar transport system ATPase subunit
MPPERRSVATMFESYALYPHLSVFDNVAFPLRAPGAPRLGRVAIDARVHELLGLVDLLGLEVRRPAELSGGQRQRVALSRALAQEARAYVLDEPISHLDAKLRHVLRGAIRRRLTARDAPAIWTSPDALETMAVADRVAVLVRGRVGQVGTPGDVYRRPSSLDVARIVGDPPLNLLRGEIGASAAPADAGLCFHHGAFALPLPAALGRRLAATRVRGEVALGLRPGEIGLAEGGAGVAASVWVWEPLGRYGILSVRLGPDLVKVKVPRGSRFEPGQIVRLDLATAEPLLFDGTDGAAL